MAEMFDSSFDVLQKSLDMYLLRHSVIADNIANAETPFFKARQVNFEGELQKAIEDKQNGIAGRDIASVQPSITEDIESESGQDRNTVDMDREMAAMTKNDMKYSAASQAVGKKFALMRYAISEGSER
jgi:flagellar basal-body rod protein FlgB